MLGLLTPKYLKSLLIIEITSVSDSLVIFFGTSLSAKCVVARATLSFAVASSMTVFEQLDNSAKYSVCPLNFIPAWLITALFIGPVRMPLHVLFKQS